MIQLIQDAQKELKAGEGDETGLSFHSFLEERASKVRSVGL